MEFLIAETICILLQIICFFPFWKIWKEDCKERGKENLAVPLSERFIAWVFVFPIWAVPAACLITGG